MYLSMYLSFDLSIFLSTNFYLFICRSLSFFIFFLISFQIQNYSTRVLEMDECNWNWMLLFKNTTFKCVKVFRWMRTFVLVLRWKRERRKCTQYCLVFLRKEKETKCFCLWKNCSETSDACQVKDDCQLTNCFVIFCMLHQKGLFLTVLTTSAARARVDANSFQTLEKLSQKRYYCFTTYFFTERRSYFWTWCLIL